MFGSQVLDLVIGLVFVYLLLSIICTAVQEIIAALFSLRARNLAKGIANLFADKRIEGLTELFYDHPLIKSLSRGTKKPSYIPAHTFALAFLDGIAPAKEDRVPVMPEIKAAIDGLPGDSELKRLLLVLLRQAGDDPAKFRAAIETWFNDAMERVSGWYKRQSQAIIFILALILTGITNADTIQIAKNLSANPALRAAVIAQAQQFANEQPKAPFSAGGPSVPPLVQPPPATTGNSREAMTQAIDNFQKLGIPLGWQALPKAEEWPNKIIGILLTMFAISLGAPFWFDVLNRVARIRSTGVTPEASAKEDKSI